MEQKDLAVFLVAGIVGALGDQVSPWVERVAWGILGVWALLKLLKVLS